MRLIPKMANIIHDKTTTTPTFKIPDADYSKAVTTNFILRLCEINLKGLSVLKSLNILTNAKFILVKDKSIRLVITMKKSN